VKHSILPFFVGTGDPGTGEYIGSVTLAASAGISTMAYLSAGKVTTWRRSQFPAARIRIPADADAARVAAGFPWLK
jgi:hypothetical protein